MSVRNDFLFIFVYLESGSHPEIIVVYLKLVSRPEVIVVYLKSASRVENIVVYLKLASRKKTEHLDLLIDLIHFRFRTDLIHF